MCPRQSTTVLETIVLVNLSWLTEIFIAPSGLSSQATPPGAPAVVAATEPEVVAHRDARTTATGQRAVCRIRWLTDPSSKPVNPPRPREPTTASPAW
jgi:hypothetical protein